MELMKIEIDARKIIIKGIKLGKQFQALELLEKAKGHILVRNVEYHKIDQRWLNYFPN